MSGLFARRDTGAARAFARAEGPAPSTGETLGAAFDDAQIRNPFTFQTARRRTEKLRALAERLGPEGEAFRGAFDRPGPQVEMREAQLFEAVRAAAQRNPGGWGGAPVSPDLVAAEVDAEMRAEQAASQEVLDRAEGFAGGAAAFAGAAAGYLADPVSSGLALVTGGAASFGRLVLNQAGLGAAGEAIALPGQIAIEDRLDLEPSDPLAQVAIGATFGASLPVAGRALKLAWTGAREVSNAALLRAARARAGSLTPEQRAAAAALEDDAAAGRNDPTTDPVAHHAALDAATRSLEAGAPPPPPDVAVRNEALAPPSGPLRRASLGDRMRQAESGGRLDARNPNSSALGPDQFIDATWLATVRRHAPELAAGRSDAEILALRTDDATSAAMRDAYARDNRAYLGERGLPVHDGAVYLAHFAGPEGAARAFRAAADAPIRDVMSDAAIAANAGVRHRGKAFAEFTAGDLIDWAKAKMGIAGGAFGDLPIPRRIADIPAASVLTDARAFQYKLAGDAEGVTDRLLNETRWDPMAGSGLMFFETGDGRMFVADGHQRSGLARRLEAQGHPPIDLQGYVFREADGWTPEAVRAVAALVNIRNESGTAADAAKFLRDFPEFAGEVNRARGFMRQADALSRLAPEPFMQVINGVLPENFGAVIGRAAPGDERLQAAMVRAFRAVEPANEIEAAAVAADVRRLGLEKRAAGAQGDLFGEAFDFGESAIGERARVLARTVADLKKDKAVFERLTREADRIEQEGNKLARSANETRAAQNRRILEAVLIAADEPGPVRDALDAAAKLAKRRNVGEGARAFAEAVRSGLDSGQIGRAFDRAANRGDAAADGAPVGAGREAADALSDAPAPVRPEDAGDTPRDLFADPAGSGAQAQVAMLEDDLFAPAPAARAADDAAPAAAAPERLADRLTPEQAAAPVVLEEGGAAITLRDALRSLDDDADALEIVELCNPRGAA